jgi:hypothetical protein
LQQPPAGSAPLGLEVRPQQPQQQQQQDVAKQQQEKPSGVPGFDGDDDDWGLGSDAFGNGDFGGSAFTGGALGAGSDEISAFGFAGLTSALELAAANLSVGQVRLKAAAKHAVPAAAGKKSADDATLVGSCGGEAGSRLPEFHVYAEEEPAGANLGFRAAGIGHGGLRPLRSMHGTQACHAHLVAQCQIVHGRRSGPGPVYQLRHRRTRA